MAAHTEIWLFLKENASDAVQRWILACLAGEPGDIDALRRTRAYAPLADEQCADGGYGRFHSMDSRDASKHVFRTTEAAVGRMRDLLLPPDDPVVRRLTNALLRHADGTLAFSDRIEKNPDFGVAIASMAAANAALLGAKDGRVERRKAACARCVEEAAARIRRGEAYETAWITDSAARRELALKPETTHTLWLIWDNPALSIEAERTFLTLLWERSVYYTFGISACDAQRAEEKAFPRWLFTLEQFMGARLFGERMRLSGVYTALEAETLKIVRRFAAPAPDGGPIGRYREGRRTADGLAWDAAARAARLLLAAERTEV